MGCVDSTTHPRPVATCLGTLAVASIGTSEVSLPVIESVLIAGLATIHLEQQHCHGSNEGSVVV